MRVERIFTRNALATSPDAPVSDAAVAMHRYQVGALLVMGGTPSEPRTVGIITDRDLAVQALAAGAPGELTVGDVMTPVVATVRESADSHEALELMRAHGVRRLVVTDDKGNVVGMLSIDDVVDGIAADLASATAVLKGEIRLDSAGLGEVKVAA